jgi:hypothetical protein
VSSSKRSQVGLMGDKYQEILDLLAPWTDKIDAGKVSKEWGQTFHKICLPMKNLFDEMCEKTAAVDKDHQLELEYIEKMLEMAKTSVVPALERELGK